VAEGLAVPHVSSGSVARSVPPTVPSPMPTASSKKRLKKIVWRVSSTCWVVRNSFCSSSGAASMYGTERVGDGVLAVEEQGEDPQRARGAARRHPLVPVDAVLAEVDLGRLQLPCSQRA
jgi:hypothetical protein